MYPDNVIEKKPFKKFSSNTTENRPNFSNPSPEKDDKFKSSKFFFPVLLLILLILVWSSVWSLFKFAVEVIPPFSFRVIIGLPACLLLFFLAYLDLYNERAFL